MTTSPRPAQIFARRQGVERGRVDQDAQRLQEGPDHVFRFGQIDADLATHGTIDLGQQRSGNLQEAEAPGVGGGNEAGQVADHAAADRDDDRLAIGAEFEQALPHHGGHVEGLRRLARLDGHDVDLDLLAGQAFGHAHGVRLLDVFVGDDDGVREFGPGGQEAAGVGKIVGADFDVVAALGQIDPDGLRSGGHGNS